MGGKIETVVTFLQMTERPRRAAPPPPAALKTAILHVETPPVHFYRYLYNQIGGDYNWVIRRQMDDAALAAVIQDEAVALYVLYVAGAPAGFAELDFGEMPDAQIVYFGLMRDMLGKGLGAWFLHHAIDLAWTREPARLLVNTCTLDHPRALPLYQRMGFEVYAQKTDYLDRLEDL